MEYRAAREIPTHLASGAERLSRLAAFLDGLQPEELTLTRGYGDGIDCAVCLATALDPWFKADAVGPADTYDLTQAPPG